MKFSTDSFTIKKDYADTLRNKISVFRESSKTKKSVFLTLITTFGVQKNGYAFELLRNDILLDDLFG
jgi:uncharacterized protein